MRVDSAQALSAIARGEGHDADTTGWKTGVERDMSSAREMLLNTVERVTACLDSTLPTPSKVPGVSVQAPVVQRRQMHSPIHTEILPVTGGPVLK